MRRHGYPAYTTSAGWLGYDDAKLARLCREAVEQGWDAVKLKVGADLADDVRRCRIAVSGSMDNRVVEYVDHLHEHFHDPVRMQGACYTVPEAPGYSARIRQETLEAHRFPDGPVWAQAQVTS